MKVTYQSLKNYAHQYLISGDFNRTLAAVKHLFEADPLDFDVRFWALKIFSNLKQNEKFIKTAEFSATLAIRGGHPAAASAFILLLEQKGVNCELLWDELVKVYSKESSYISQYGGKIAPLPDDTPVEAPDELAETSETLIDEVFAGLTDQKVFGELPEKLQSMPLMSELDAQTFKAVAKQLVLHELNPNERIIKEGESGKSFYFLANGKLEVFKTDFQGRVMHLANLHSGAIFGEMALVQHAPRGASVSAVSLSYVLEFTVSSLSEMADKLSILADALDNFTRERLLKNLINTNKLFKPFSTRQKRDLLRHFQAYVVEADTEIIKEGEQGTGLYLILSGEVDVIKNAGTENEIKVATVYSTESFGEISLISDGVTTASVVAARRTTLLFLAKHYFTRLIESVPQLKEYFEELSRERIENTESVVSENYNTEENEEFILI